MTAPKTNRLGTYDVELQMFAEPIHELRMETLLSLRWSAERAGRTVSDPRGEAAGEEPPFEHVDLPGKNPFSVPAAIAARRGVPPPPVMGKDFHTHRPNCCPSCALEEPERHPDDPDERVPA